MKRISFGAHAGASVFAALLLTSLASAQNSDTVRVRGSIQSVDGQTLDVKGRDGTPLKVKLADDVKVLALERKSMDDVKQGVFVGITAMPQPDGTQKAVEIHIFPEALRGMGEGHRPWDLMPNSTMTNGAIGQTVTGVEGPVITIKYKDGEKKIIVTSEVPIVRYEIGDKGELKPGAAVSITAAKKNPDGTFGAARINVGRGGAVPM